MGKTDSVSRSAVVDELERVLASESFRGAERSTALLRYIVERALDGQSERLKEYSLGVEALGRASAFDPRIDPIVRAEASRLRNRLDRYYAADGSGDAMRILLPKGSYVPRFQVEELATDSDLAKADEETALRHDPAPLTHQRRIVWIVLAALASVTAFVGGLWFGRQSSPPTTSPVLRLDVRLTSDRSLGSEVGTDVVISGDGTRIAFVSKREDGVARLSTRLLSEAKDVELPGTEDARGPFFSPDGRWIGFWAAGKLEKVATDGGSPVVLCDATDLLGASWSEDGTIIATFNSTGTLWRVSADGGAPRLVADFSRDSVQPRWPQVLPGGTDVLYTAARDVGADRADIEVLSLRSGARKVLVHGGTFGRYLSSGALAYINQGTLYVAPMDLDGMRLRGPAEPVLDDIAYAPTFGYAQIDFSRTGTVVFRKPQGSGLAVAAWVDSAGATQPLVDTPGRYGWPRLSGDGRRLAMAVVDGGILTTAFYERGAAHERAVRLPRSVLQYGAAIWTPDSRFVVMSGPQGIWWMRDGAEPQSLLRSSNRQVPWSFSPNGSRLAYYEMSPSSAFDLWTVPILSGAEGLHAGKPELYLRTPAYEVYPSFSPDGRWLAYSTNEAGTWQVYVRRFPDDGSKVRVSEGGGRVPQWSPNGQDLFYGTDDQRLMVVRYSTRGGSFVPGRPRLWARARLADTGVLPNYDLASDGRVVALLPADSAASRVSENEVTVLTGFFEKLRRRRSASRLP